MATFLFGGAEGVLAQAPITYCLPFAAARARYRQFAPPGGVFYKHTKQALAQ